MTFATPKGQREVAKGEQVNMANIATPVTAQAPVQETGANPETGAGHGKVDATVAINVSSDATNTGEAPAVEVSIEAEPGNQVVITDGSVDVDAAQDEVWDAERARHTLQQFRAREKEFSKKLGEVATQLKSANQRILSFEDAQAAKQQEFEKLAVERGAKIQDLENTLISAQQSLDTRLAEATSKTEILVSEVHKMVDDELRNWPEKVKGLVPKRSEASAEVRLERLRVARPIAQDLMTLTPEPLPGNVPVPSGGTPTRQQPTLRNGGAGRPYEIL